MFRLLLCFLLGMIHLTLWAQTDDESESYHSHVEVRIIGYPCTEIASGVVGSAPGTDGSSSTSWRLPKHIVLPPLHGKPCPSAGAVVRELTSITVTAIAETYGDIRALPGQITSIMNPTAGWINVTNTKEAVPGMSLANQCKAALAENGIMGAYYPGLSEMYNLVPVMSDGSIDVYINKQDLLEQRSIAKNNTAFSAFLYFVFRDEAQRKLAVRHISEVYPRVKAENLKYLVMNVGYSPYGLDPRIARPNGEAITGPTLSVGYSRYIEPVRCTASTLYRSLRKPAGITEAIIYPSTGSDVPTFLGDESGFYDNCTDCKRWSIFLGDLTPLRNGCRLPLLEYESTENAVHDERRKSRLRDT